MSGETQECEGGETAEDDLRRGLTLPVSRSFSVVKVVFVYQGQPNIDIWQVCHDALEPVCWIDEWRLATFEF